MARLWDPTKIWPEPCGQSVQPGGAAVWRAGEHWGVVGQVDYRRVFTGKLEVDGEEGFKWHLARIPRVLWPYSRRTTGRRRRSACRDGIAMMSHIAQASTIA